MTYTTDQLRALVRIRFAVAAPMLYTNDELARLLLDAREAFGEKE